MKLSGRITGPMPLPTVLGLLAVAAFLTLAFEATGEPRPTIGIAVGALFTALAISAFGWIESLTGTRRLLGVAGYVLVGLGLAFATFSLVPGVGATLLLMVLVSQSVLLVGFPAAALVVAVTPLVHLGMSMRDGLRNGLGTLAAAGFTAVVTELLERERRARAELAEANAQLRDHAAQAEQLATAQERIRLGRDIHDGLGHHLTVVQMQLQAARAMLRSDLARAETMLGKAQQQATDALAEVRRSVAALREPRETPPLPDALRTLAAEASAAGTAVEVEIAGIVRELAPEVADSLFRTAQEGLTNVRKHARATTARLLLDYGADGTVRLEVSDDGIGITPHHDRTGFGLVGLRERVTGLGGRVDVQDNPGHGLLLRVEVPS